MTYEVYAAMKPVVTRTHGRDNNDEALEAMAEEREQNNESDGLPTINHS
jgi:hypothetical protein